MDLSIFSHKEEFIRLVIGTLGKMPVDFCETFDFVNTENVKQSGSWGMAGVLLPIFFRKNGGGGEAVFRLIKRSTSVVQGGDISCPGGMLHHTDPLFRHLVASRLIPVLSGPARDFAINRGSAQFRRITLFLANALRESWEEIGLNPLNVAFLGPLPCNPLIAFTRIIFPLVGFIKKDWQPRLSWEVDKIVDIPLIDFFKEENFCLYTIETEYPIKNVATVREFPCFSVKDGNGGEDILWGATFYIILNFLKSVFGHDLPTSHSKRILRKVLDAEYLGKNSER